MPDFHYPPLPFTRFTGKSCLIRTAALVAIMAQMGSFVPAESAELHVFDGVFTRMGASDNLLMGRRCAQPRAPLLSMKPMCWREIA